MFVIMLAQILVCVCDFFAVFKVYFVFVNKRHTYIVFHFMCLIGEVPTLYYSKFNVGAIHESPGE